MYLFEIQRDYFELPEICSYDYLRSKMQFNKLKYSIKYISNKWVLFFVAIAIMSCCYKFIFYAPKTATEMKKIYYLVQGKADQYQARYSEMQDSGAEIIFLTWDKHIDEAIFLPNSTWEQGRNHLLQHILTNKYDFDYLVFIDGDAEPIKGSWKDFNDFLSAYQPQICIPVMPCARRTVNGAIKFFHLPIPIPKWQRAVTMDQQVQAIRKDVINAIGDVIYPQIFNHDGLYRNCNISDIVLTNMTPYNVIQFNGLEIGNNVHENIPKGTSFSTEDFVKNFSINKTYLLPLIPIKTNILSIQKICNHFIELTYWLFPLPIKEFDTKKRAKTIIQAVESMYAEVGNFLKQYSIDG